MLRIDLPGEMDYSEGSETESTTSEAAPHDVSRSSAGSARSSGSMEYPIVISGESAHLQSTPFEIPPQYPYGHSGFGAPLGVSGYQACQDQYNQDRRLPHSVARVSPDPTHGLSVTPSFDVAAPHPGNTLTPLTPPQISRTLFFQSHPHSGNTPTPLTPPSASHPLFLQSHPHSANTPMPLTPPSASQPLFIQSHPRPHQYPRMDPHARAELYAHLYPHPHPHSQMYPQPLPQTPSPIKAEEDSSYFQVTACKQARHRNKANQGERRRNQNLSSALNQLRAHLPQRHLMLHTRERLSKVKTLRLAVSYIRALGELVHCPCEVHSGATQRTKLQPDIRAHVLL